MCRNGSMEGTISRGQVMYRGGRRIFFAKMLCPKRICIFGRGVHCVGRMLLEAFGPRVRREVRRQYKSGGNDFGANLTFMHTCCAREMFRCCARFWTCYH